MAYSTSRSPGAAFVECLAGALELWACHARESVTDRFAVGATTEAAGLEITTSACVLVGLVAEEEVGVGVEEGGGRGRGGGAGEGGLGLGSIVFIHGGGNSGSAEQDEEEENGEAEGVTGRHGACGGGGRGVMCCGGEGEKGWGGREGRREASGCIGRRMREKKESGHVFFDSLLLISCVASSICWRAASSICCSYCWCWCCCCCVSSCLATVISLLLRITSFPIPSLPSATTLPLFPDPIIPRPPPRAL